MYKKNMLGKKKDKEFRSFRFNPAIWNNFTKRCDEEGFMYVRKIELLLEAWVKEQKGG